MRIILSPAKEMRVDDGLPWVDYPVFLNRTQILLEVLQGTICKMARGEMVRYMARSQINNVEDIKSFNLLDFHYAPEHSDDKNFTFLR